jgi:hypothetical protein
MAKNVGGYGKYSVWELDCNIEGENIGLALAEILELEESMQFDFVCFCPYVTNGVMFKYKDE